MGSMGILVLTGILSVGFLYTELDPKTRFRLKRASGWASYFQIAKWGFLFCAAGFVVIISIALFFNLIAFILNLFLSWIDHSIPYLWGWSGQSIVTASIIAGATLSFTKGQHNQLSLKKDPARAMREYARIAEDDGLEKTIYDSMANNLLVMVTMNSRKVYVGLVQSARFMNADVEYITLLPMLSGYRDKDTLRYIEEHSYVQYYASNKISADSKPLSLFHFRTVVPTAKIDSIALFDPGTYRSFSPRKTIRFNNLKKYYSN